MPLLLAATIQSLIRGFKHSKLNQSDLRIGQQLNLLPDNDNHHDVNAVAVKTTDGDHVGHVAKEFALTFRKLIAFAIRIGILIVVALKGFEHGRYNKLLLEMSFFVGDAQLAAEAGEQISRLVQDCALRARLPSVAAPTESPDAGELIRLQRELAIAKEKIGAARRELSANAATETIEREAASRSSANRQLQKAKQEQTDMEILLESTKASLQRTRRDLKVGAELIKLNCPKILF